LAPIEGAKEWVEFKNAKGDTSNGVELRCALTTACDLRLVLSWNDFKDDPDLGTDKQLNLYLYDDKKSQIAASEKIQMLNPPADDKKYSKLPRQMIVTTLAPGTLKGPKKYTARVKIVSRNFSASVDKLRITASGLGIELLDPTLGETLLPPADNPGVIDIGASDDPQSSGSKVLKLPKILFKSLLELKNGLRPFESSTAAAMAGAMTALYLGTGTENSRLAVEKKLLTISRPAEFSSPPASAEQSHADTDEKRKSSPVQPKYHPVERAAHPVHPPLRLKNRPGPGGHGISYYNQPPQQPCLIPVPPVVGDPLLNQQLAGLLSFGGAALTALNNQLLIAVNYDVGAQVGFFPTGPNDRIYLTRYGLALLDFNYLYLLGGQPFIPVITTSAPLCQ
jgi:hypothetical protein